MAKEKFFIYSKEQYNFRMKQEALLGRRFKEGYIISKGKKELITEINSTGFSNYSDAKIVARGDPNKLKYEAPGYYS